MKLLILASALVVAGTGMAQQPANTPKPLEWVLPHCASHYDPQSNISTASCEVTCPLNYYLGDDNKNASDAQHPLVQGSKCWLFHWPVVVSTQGILDPVENAQNGNKAKPCGPDSHDAWCVDPAMRHITNRLYGVSKDSCEYTEGVPCEELQPCVVSKFESYESCRRWVPIGKPVFVDETPDALTGDTGGDITHSDSGTPKQEKPPTADVLTGCSDSTCVAFSNAIATPDPEVSWASPKITPDRKIYALDVAKDWTCSPTALQPTAVTIVCLKSEPSADEHKGGTK